VTGVNEKGLNNCHVFEVVARTGKTGKHSRFAMLHAVAVSAFGSSQNKITKTCAYRGFFWNKINLRWHGTTHDYKLEIRTGRNYGDNTEIFYKVGKLWDDELFMPQDYYYDKKE
jgi:hypothetical protein